MPNGVLRVWLFRGPWSTFAQRLPGPHRRVGNASPIVSQYHSVAAEGVVDGCRGGDDRQGTRHVRRVRRRSQRHRLDPDPVVTSSCQEDAPTIAAQYSDSTLDPASGFTQPKVNRYYLTGVESDACKGRQISVAVLIDNRSDPHCQVARLTDGGFTTTVPGSIHQDLPSEPGDVMLWSFKHRATDPNQTDAVELLIGDSDHQNGGHPMTSTGIFTTAVADGWVTYSGAYTVPNGQKNTRFELRSAGGSTQPVPANIDAASITPDYCLAPVFKELPTAAISPG